MRCAIFILLVCCKCYLMSNLVLSERVTIHNGISNDTDEIQRIVGGRRATCEEFPHQVNFIVNNSYFCGGFIISERYILTAAHCAQNVNPTTVVLRSGSTFRRNGTVLPIIEVIPFPNYDKPPFDKDVAVMKTAEVIKFDSCTQPMALPKKGPPPRPGTIMTISGWGRTKEGASTLPDVLMAVDLPVVSHSRCQAAYWTLTITENMLCAGNFFMGDKSTCQGDSGGVASVNGVAAGIVSFGRGCGQRFSPSVFTNIAAPAMRNFIEKYTGL